MWCNFVFSEMIIYISDLQKEHFNVFNKFSTLELVNFCKLAIDYLNNGCNPEKYSNAANVLNINATDVQNAVHAIVYLLVEGCKHNLSESDFKSSLAIAGFTTDQQEVLLKLFKTKKDEISNTLHLLKQKDATYQDFTWRFEIQVASRNCESELKPIVAMNFITKTPKHSTEIKEQNPSSITVNYSIQEAKAASHCQNVITHNIAQCDLSNLLHLTEKLEQAMRESRSQHIRQVQRNLR